MNKEIKNNEFIKLIAEKNEPLVEMPLIKNNIVSFIFTDEETHDMFYTEIKGVSQEQSFQSKMDFIDKLSNANKSIIFAEGEPLSEAVDNPTTIRIHQSTLNSLKSVKITKGESYELVIRRLLMYYKENDHMF